MNLSKKGTLYKLGQKRGLFILFFAMFGLVLLVGSSFIQAEPVDSIERTDVDETNAIDTGLYPGYGVKLDLVENGLTHKVLEIDLGSTYTLSSEKLSLLITDIDFDVSKIKNKQLSVKKSKDVQKNVREAVCNPYTIDPGYGNGSLVEVANCTTLVTGKVTVSEDYWEAVSLEKKTVVANEDLGGVTSLTGQVFRLSFDVSITQREDGSYGNAGTIYVGALGNTFVDLQHSSDWNTSYAKKKAVYANMTAGSTNNLKILANGSALAVGGGGIFGNNTYINITDPLNTSNSIVAYLYYNNEVDYAFSNALETAGIPFYSDGGPNASVSGMFADTEAFYMMQGGNATRVYDATATYHGELKGGAFLNSSSGGIVGKYVTNPGTEDSQIYTALGHDVMEFADGTSWTTSIWFKYCGGGGDYVNGIFGRMPNSGAAGRFAFYIIPDNTLHMYIADSDNVPNTGEQVTATTFNDCAWHRTTATFDGPNDDIYWYVDGVQEFSDTASTWGPFTSVLGTCIGALCKHTGTPYMNAGGGTLDSSNFNGDLDELHIFNRYMTADEVNRTFNYERSSLGAEELTGNVPITPDPVFHTATAYNNINLNCSVSSPIVDPDNDTMTVYFNLTVNDIDTAQETLLNQLNGSVPIWEISSDNYSKHDNVTCNITLFDGALLSETNSTSLTVLNSVPVVDSFNATSLNRSLTYTDNSEVTYQENESLRFAVDVSDADADSLTYLWYLDGALQGAWTSFLFEWKVDFVQAGLHSVKALVNDTDNVQVVQLWNVTIEDVVNKLFSVGFVDPTPVNGANVTDSSINFSVVVTPTVLDPSVAMNVFHTSSGDFDGTHNLTQFNATDNSIQLIFANLTGTYTSLVYDATKDSSWDNISWGQLIPSAGELSFEAGMVGLWHMNEVLWDGTPNEVVDDSGIANHGTANTPNGPITVADGRFNRGGEFDSNDDVQVSDTLFPSGSSVRSVEGWIRTATTVGAAETNGIFSYGTPTNDYYAAFAVSNHTLYVDADGAGTDFVRGSVVVDDSNWHHVAYTYDGSTVRLYVDGSLDSSGAVAFNTQLSGTGQFSRYTNTGSKYLAGTFDEFVVWNKTLNASEILSHYNAEVGSVRFKVRSCDDAACSGESFTGPAGNGGYYTDHSFETLNVSDNRYFQYKLFLETNVATHTPKLYNVTVNGLTLEVVSDVTISEAWLDMGGDNVSMTGSGNSWSFVNSSLATGTFSYKVYANDSFGNLNVTEQRSFIVPSYNITFNVVSGEDGSPLNGTTITCNYTGFSQGGDSSNPYGPYVFPTGNWECTFVRAQYYTKTQTFITDETKTISVVLEQQNQLTIQEHDWLRDLYDCVIGGDCTAYKFWESTNATTEKIWDQFLPTDSSVVAEEVFLNRDLSSSTNISINYTLNIPFKEGFDDGELLPLRILYWITDVSNTTCYSQDKRSGTQNVAESPSCVPLVAEYVGPNNGTITFQVDLHPDLPDGTYNVVRSIDIDPPVNGEPVWINYGREIIGNIAMKGNVLSDAAVPKVSSTTSVQAKVPSLAGLASLTGSAVQSVKDTATNPFAFLIGLAMICLTTLGVFHIKNKKRY